MNMSPVFSPITIGDLREKGFTVDYKQDSDNYLTEVSMDGKTSRMHFEKDPSSGNIYLCSISEWDGDEIYVVKKLYEKFPEISIISDSDLYCLWHVSEEEYEKALDILAKGHKKYMLSGKSDIYRNYADELDPPSVEHDVSENKVSYGDINSLVVF